MAEIPPQNQCKITRTVRSLGADDYFQASKQEDNMKRVIIVLGCAAAAVLSVATMSLAHWGTEAALDVVQRRRPIYDDRRFDVQIVVNGRALEEYAARGRTYVEALAGAEYAVRVRNPFPYRVAVALSVDGLNTIDAQHTSAWNASKWVIEPYGSIEVAGWQMSSQRARRFYFTSESDSYGAKLGQTSNLGNIAAVFFRERIVNPVTVVPAPRPIYRGEEDSKSEARAKENAGAGTADSSRSQNAPLARKEAIRPQPDDEYAATGIGRSVHNDVRWVNLELESRPAGEVVIRYEYYPALVRLGVMPRPYPRPDALDRRERAGGFSPEP
jgi:hypothetical protein